MKTTWDEIDSRWISAALWKHLPLDPVTDKWDRRGNISMVDDFTDFGGILASTDGRYQSEGNSYRSYQTAVTFITNVAETPTPASVDPIHRGAISLSGQAGVVDNDVETLVHGGNIDTPYGSFPYSMIPGMSGDLCFEARFKIDTIVASLGNFFIGLAGAAGVDTASANAPIASDVLATTLSNVGFGKFGASTTALGLFYERASGTVGTIAAQATLEANTYIKAGFFWDSTRNTLTPYINGAPVAAAKRVTSAISGLTPWPNDYMTPVAAVRQIDGTTELKLTMDWWACAQLSRVASDAY